MSRPNTGKGKNRNLAAHGNQMVLPKRPLATSMLDVIKEGREFESLIDYQFQGVKITDELAKCLKLISEIRKRPVVCYAGNIVKPPRDLSVSIDATDDLPFNEMIRSIPSTEKKIDIVLVTGGGTGEQVSKFVNALRPRFDEVGFIILNIAMSAGTIFAMSGDEIIMGDQSYIGPIDPQVRSKDGAVVPAQSIVTLIDDINDRGQKALDVGQQPRWVDLQILRNIDPRDIGKAINASNYSIQMVRDYLNNYKFKTWTTHSTTGKTVTAAEKIQRSHEIASLLCDHAKWKNHGHGISREEAWDVCKLKITHAESIPGLAQIMRKKWAILYWFFERMPVGKLFLSESYCIIRIEPLS